MLQTKRGKSTIVYIEKKALLFLWLLLLVAIINNHFKFDCIPTFAVAEGYWF